MISPLLFILACSTLAFIQASSAAEFDTFAPNGEMYVGVDYYPEHWPEDRWEYDIKLMHDAGFNVVRLAEFGWVLMEPQEGQLDFAWLDKILALLQQYDIKVILGTPSAVMPAWVAQKYPQTLAQKADGTRIIWGGRKNNCFSDTTYHRLSKRITRAMADHFGKAPNVIGWQTDNEFGGTDCRCDQCLANFQNWLREKYKTLDELNRAWGTHFWGLKLQGWKEITIPDDRTGDWAISNPSASLDWMRFTSDLNVQFQAEQVKILRAVCPNHFITHNFMGLFNKMDYYKLARDLDFVSWDNYPTFADGDQISIHYDPSYAADVMRGLKGKNFWIMEQTAGPHGWAVFTRNPRPGELRKMCYQQLAHGADAQIWFRWRTCTAGREQYWHGLLGHDGKPLRRYQEAAQVAQEYKKLSHDLIGTTVQTPVAMIYDYDSIWALEIQPGFSGHSHQDAIRRYYHALFRAGQNVDMIKPDADLTKYKIVFAPALHVLPDDIAMRLDAFVKSGGILITDCRTAVKDETNLAHARTLPGLLSQALGIRIEEYESIGTETLYKVASASLGDLTGRRYADWVTPETAETVAQFTGPWHVTEFAAVTRNKYGKGQGWYVGAIFKEDVFYDKLVNRLLQEANIRPVVRPPEGVEASVREGDGVKILFLINHTEDVKSVRIPAGKIDLLTGEKTDDVIELDEFAVAVIKM